MNILEKINTKLDWLAYKRVLFNKEGYKVNNIFNYNFTVTKRPNGYRDIFASNQMYGMGFQLRRYANYYKQIYAVSEHAVSPTKLDNVNEYKDNKAPVLFVQSEDRRKLLADKTDKLMFTFGPSFMPYCEGVYNEFSINTMKVSMGKTIVVFPQHNNDDSAYVGFMNSVNSLIQYVNNIKEEHGYDTVLACLYYPDVERGMGYVYEQAGWRVVSCGHNKNYDFGDCLKSIIQLSDLVITQGFTGICYSTYLGKPAIYYDAVKELQMQSGFVREGLDWLQIIQAQIKPLFGEYHETISEEQYEYINENFGLDCVKTREQIRLILEYSRDIRRRYQNDKYVLRVASRKKYLPIKDLIIEAVKIREENNND